MLINVNQTIKHKLIPHLHDELLCCEHGTTKTNLKFNKEKIKINKRPN